MQEQNENDRAIEYFKKALSKDKMENALQGSLYYSYSLCCFKKGKCGIAKEYINKALDIEPNNYGYQLLYNKVKYCK
jgi:tetratricopeptide (TPR) repeat protein